MVSAVLFDVDGTLVDTTFVNAVCWAEALRQHGHRVPTVAVRDAIGMPGDRLLERLAPDADDPEAIAAAHLTLYRQWWGRLQPLPGARELLRGCAAESRDVVLASSASRQELDVLTRVLDADDAIAATTTASDVDSGKPAPDLLHAALSKLGVTPDDALFVGDAVWDGQAARHAGVRFVGVTCGGTCETDLRDAGAEAVYRDPAHLCADLGRLVGRPAR